MSKQLPQATLEHRSLAERTLVYWRLSQAWEGRGSFAGKLTVGQALDTTKNLMLETNPHKPLGKRVLALEQAIVIGSKPKKDAANTSQSSQQP